MRELTWREHEPEIWPYTPSTAAFRTVGPVPHPGKTVELSLRAWKQENWPLSLLPTVVGELARTMLESRPLWYR